MYNRTLFPRNWLHDQRLPYTSGKLKSGASTPTCGRSNATLTVETPFRQKCDRRGIFRSSNQQSCALLDTLASTQLACGNGVNR